MWRPEGWRGRSGPVKHWLLIGSSGWLVGEGRHGFFGNLDLQGRPGPPNWRAEKGGSNGLHRPGRRPGRGIGMERRDGLGQRGGGDARAAARDRSVYQEVPQSPQKRAPRGSRAPQFAQATLYPLSARRVRPDLALGHSGRLRRAVPQAAPTEGPSGSRRHVDALPTFHAKLVSGEDA